MVAGIGRKHNDPVQHISIFSEKAGRHVKGGVADDQHPLKFHQLQKQKQQTKKHQQQQQQQQAKRQQHGAVPGQKEMGTNNGTTAALATRDDIQTKQLQVTMPKRRYVLRPPAIRSSSSNNNNALQQQLACNIDSEESQEEEQLMVAGILEGITSLCLGPIDPLTNPASSSSSAKGRHHRERRKRENKIKVESSSNSSRPRRPSSLISDSSPDLLPGPSKKKRVVYPIASYGGKLNCQKLISERRQVFQQNLFRPVSNDEMSIRF